MWVHPGDRIVVGLAGGEPFSDELMPPSSSDAGVLRPVRSSGREAARVVGRAGRAEAVVATPFCGSFSGSDAQEQDEWQTCPVVSVVVKSRAEPAQGIPDRREGRYFATV